MTNTKLIKCSDCGREISPNATLCPGCGAKNKKPMGWITKSFLIFIGFIFIISFFGNEPASTPAPVNVAGATPAPTVTGPENWTVDQSKSDMDDSPLVTIATEGSTLEYSSWQKVVPTLILRCKENSTDIIIDVGKMIDYEHDSDFTEYAVGRIRYDTDKAFTATFNTSTDHNAFFFRKPIAAAKKMLDHKTMVFEFQPFSMGIYRTTFNIEGLKEKIGPLQKACNW